MIKVLKKLPFIVFNTTLAGVVMVGCIPSVRSNELIKNDVSTSSCDNSTLEKHSKLIKELYVKALKNNPEIANAHHKWQSKIYLERADFSSYFPSISILNSSSFWYNQKEYYRSWSPEGEEYLISDDIYDYNTPANLSASVDVVLLDFQKFSNTKSINKDTQAAESEYNLIVKSILLEVLDSYIRFQVLNNVLDISQDIVEEFELLSDTQSVLLEEGFATILDVTNQYNILLNSRASLEQARNELKAEINKLKKLTLMDFSHDDDSIKLPGPECIPNYTNTTRLYEIALENSDELKRLIYSADSINSKAQSEIYRYLPKIKAGYTTAYQWQEGNLNGYNKSGEQYGSLQGSPYVAIELKFNLAGEEYQTYKSLKEDRNAVNSSANTYKRDLEEIISNSLETIASSRIRFGDHIQVYRKSKSAINLLSGAMHTGFVDVSSFTQLQNTYYESVRSTATDISSILSAYALINRFTGYSPEPKFPFQVYIPKEES